MRAGIVIPCLLACSLSAGCLGNNPLFMLDTDGMNEPTSPSGPTSMTGMTSMAGTSTTGITGTSSAVTGDLPTGGSTLTDALTSEPTTGGTTTTESATTLDTTSSSTTGPNETSETGTTDTGGLMLNLPVCEAGDPLLVACYDFEFMVDAPVKFPDGSMYGNHGSIVNPMIVMGVVGTAIRVGMLTKLNVGAAASLSPLSSLTMTAFVRLGDSQNKNRFVVNKQDEYHLIVTPDGLQCGVGLQQLVTVVEIPPDKWVHVACTYDHGQFNMYVDGGLVGFATKPEIPLNGTTSVLNVGCGADCTVDTRLDGALDAVRLWSVALSLVEVGHQAGKP